MCTPYRVSTITANGDVGAPVRLESFFSHIRIRGPGELIGFCWVELGESRNRGINIRKRRPGIKKKIFDNQATVIYCFRDGYQPNIKIFRNGNVQMTGIKTIEDGKKIVQLIADEVNRIYQEHDPDIMKPLITIPVSKDAETDGPAHVEASAQNFKIRMINSDFAAPFRLRRKDLHQLLINKYHNTCSYQPETYPGVKLQYFWNKSTWPNNGCCICETPCFGKGLGDGDGGCKKVTVSVFQSGKVLVTGATAFEQVNAAYNFICTVIMENQDQIQWAAPTAAA